MNYLRRFALSVCACGSSLVHVTLGEIHNRNEQIAEIVKCQGEENGRLPGRVDYPRRSGAAGILEEEEDRRGGGEKTKMKGTNKIKSKERNNK